MMFVEFFCVLVMFEVVGKIELFVRFFKWGKQFCEGVLEYGVVYYKKYGDVFVYEVDGYGLLIMMDDVNYLLLLVLLLMGFCDVDDEVYQNMRKMILEKNGNLYYLKGLGF